MHEDKLRRNKNIFSFDQSKHQNFQSTLLHAGVDISNLSVFCHWCTNNTVKASLFPNSEGKQNKKQQIYSIIIVQ
jgi:phosphoserine aminotransferase